MAQKVRACTVGEAKRMDRRYVGTEHILIARGRIYGDEGEDQQRDRSGRRG